MHSVLRHLVQPGHSEHLAQRAHLECWNHWGHQALEFREPKAQPGSTELREQLAHRVRRPVDLELEAQHLLQMVPPELLVLKAHSEHPEQLERPVK